VRKYKSFVIFTEWHEELNPDHGYYVTRWINDDVENDDEERLPAVEIDTNAAKKRRGGRPKKTTTTTIPPTMYVYNDQ
jgi:hypothetical protein